MRVGTIALVIVFGLLSQLRGQNMPTRESVAALAQQIQPTATKSLSEFSKLVTEQNSVSMGFHDPNEVRSATLGQPLQVFKVGLDSLRDYRTSEDPKKLLHSGDEVIYPVLLQDAARSSITLAKVGNEWKAIAFGEPQLVKLIHGAKEKAAAKAGAEPLFIVQVPALNTVFVGYQRGGTLMLTPVVDDSRFGFKAGESIPASDAFGKMVRAAQSQRGDAPS